MIVTIFFKNMVIGVFLACFFIRLLFHILSMTRFCDFASFLLSFFVPFLISHCPYENAETKTKYIFLVYVSIDLYNARTGSSFLMHELFKHIGLTLFIN